MMWVPFVIIEIPMIVSPDADELLAEIRELRSARREQYARDLAAIDEAYDRTRQRVGDAKAFPLVASLLQRARGWRRALRRRPR